MPGFDKTGPEGKGPRTGRGLGISDNKKSGRNLPDKNKNSWLDIILSVLKLLKK